MDHCRADNDGTIKFTKQEADLLIAAQDIKQTFIECPCQKIAFDALIADIMNCDFVWTSKVGSEQVQQKLDINDSEHAMWTEFTRSIVLELCLYGFAVYRLVKIKNVESLETREIAKTPFSKRRKQVRKTRHLPEVANGQNIALRWSKDNREWIPYSESGKAYQRKDGWRMIMSTKPLRWGSTDIAIYNSFAAKSIELSKMYTTTRRNAETRDEINSDIGVYTTMMKNITSPGTGVSTKPWFQPAVHGAMSAAPGDMHQVRITKHPSAAIVRSPL